MKKVLVITYYWPPSGGAGVQRWVKFVKYLRSFDWEPVVFTPENPERPVVDESLQKEFPDDIEIIKNKIWEPYSFYKKLTGRRKDEKIQTAFLNEKENKSSFLENISLWVRSNLFIPDARKYWIGPSVKLLKNYLARHKIDALVTTGPPHSAHLIGLKLYNLTGIPWIADFRDPWTNIDYYGELKLSSWADHLHHKMEKQVLQTATAVTVISTGMVDDFRKIHDRDFAVIPNGFDPDDFLNIPQVNLPKNNFTISHIGSLTKTRNPKNLWKALQLICQENDEFAEVLEIRNIGKIDVSVIDSIKRARLDHKLVSIDYLPHDEVIIAQREAAILLLPINNTPNAKLILTGKLFEYLNSDRPIICIGPVDGDAAKIITETETGSVYGFNNIEHLKSDLIKMFEKFKTGNLDIKARNIQQYERKTLTKKMAQVLNACVASQSGSGSQNS